MSSKKGIHFTITVSKKQPRNAYAIAVAKGEALRGARVNSKKYKELRNRSSWKDEDWGE